VEDVLEVQRACDDCGGAVDVMTIVKPLNDGRSMPTKIGACLRCGKWFNEAGLIELTRPAPTPIEQDSPE
jgi:hypothetical protein